MNWSDYLHPLHPEGRKFVLPLGAVTVLMLFVAWPLFLLGLALTLFCAYFFRDPARYVPDSAGIIVSPADGRVVGVGLALPPPELSLGAETRMRISIFLSVIDVHVTRAPDAATVEKAVYVPGKFLNASLDKASEDNERLLLQLRTGGDHVLGVALIAGLV
ncbi:MAG: phosphatidylserine decarboxylase family protein, partial [Alphaproteobacteria bacterium]